MKHRARTHPFVIGLIAAILIPLSASASLLTQIDSFDSGLENWDGQTGSGPSNPPTHETTGGPDGVGDAYLQLFRDPADEFHIGMKNTTQWTGNYSAAGVTALQVDLNHIAGTDPLKIRIMVWGAGGVWGSTSTTPLPAAGGGWNSYTFGLTAADLTYVSGGTANLSDTLSAVTTLLIRHDYATPTPPGQHPEHVHGTLGLDNIQAIPEPATLFYMLSASIGLMLGRRKAGPHMVRTAADRFNGPPSDPLEECWET